MTIKDAKIYIRKELSDLYPENEIFGFIKIIFSDLYNISAVQLITKEENYLTSKEYQILTDVIKRLKTFEPIQYIIGYTEFYGSKIFLNSNVLIPRPETEELVDLIIIENKDRQGLKILDIGTGSGCIAISLAKNLSSPDISALDISREALDITRRNSLENKLELTLIQANILNKSFNIVGKKFDLIVSNPPYVTISEKELMKENVLNYEPELALFVKDSDPLIFYNAVIQFSMQHLNPKGILYFEINEKFGNDLKDILISEGFTDVKIIKDINGKARILKCKL